MAKSFNPHNFHCSTLQEILREMIESLSRLDETECHIYHRYSSLKLQSRKYLKYAEKQLCIHSIDKEEFLGRPAEMKYQILRDFRKNEGSTKDLAVANWEKLLSES